MPETSYFQTKSLQLRPFEPDDLLALKDYLNHPELAGRRYLPWGTPEDLPLSSQQVEGILHKWGEEDGETHLAIIRSAGPTLIGHAEFGWGWDSHHPYLAIVIAPEHQGRGSGSETLSLLLRYLFENTPAYNVSGWIADWNHAAYRFACKHGFQESGRSRREGLRHGVYYDEIVVNLLRPEWRSHQEG
jgi:RimJ/RimL family protein N-acetyltransferase